MMKAASPTFSESVILPEVILVLVYAFLVRVWSVWAFSTLRAVRIGEQDPSHMVSGAQLIGVTVINVALLCMLGLAAVRTKHSSPSLRRGHLAGIGLAIIVTVLVQVAALRGYSLEAFSGAAFLENW